MLSALDSYFETHTISTIPGVSPNALQYCSMNVEYHWEMKQDYQLKAGYNMGIWVSPDIISWSQAYNQYGFNEIFINPGDAATANQAGFSYPHMMVALPQDSADAVTTYNNIYTNNFGYYYVDEPAEHYFDGYAFQYLESLVAQNTPNAKMMFSEYKWPVAALCNFFSDYNNDGSWLTNNNSGIMCDQYVLSNPCGDMEQFWNEYWGYYGVAHSWTNWADNTGSNAGNWPYCFDFMNSKGLNHIWLYADETGTEGQIQQWCGTAWQKGWNLEYAQQVATQWACVPNGSCPTCTWTVLSSWYTGSTAWLAYGQ